MSVCVLPIQGLKADRMATPLAQVQRRFFVVHFFERLVFFLNLKVRNKRANDNQELQQRLSPTDKAFCCFATACELLNATVT